LGEGDQKKLAGEGFSKRIEEDEESSSEDEGWCAGVPAFKGTPSVVILESNEAVEESLISDDEDNENIEKVGHDLEAVIEEKGGGDNLKEGLLCKQVLNSGEKLHGEAVGDKTNEVAVEEVLEEGLDQAVQGAELSAGESDAEDAKSDTEGSSDEAPEEIKTVKCYENEEESAEADVHSRSIKTSDCDEKLKPSRKRKRKAKKIGADNESEAVVAQKEETDSMPAKSKKEKAAAEPKEKIAKITRQSVLEQRIRPPTLLERLLLQEIKKERNTILQCVRYVCKNNFFEANKST